MFGKSFSTMYTGSMRYNEKIGPTEWAVWGYAIANTDAKGWVELYPVHLASVLHTTPLNITEAIVNLSAEDPGSRSYHPVYGTKRLVHYVEEDRQNDYWYFLPNHAKYQDIFKMEDQKRQNRQRQAKYKAKKAGLQAKNSDSNAR